MDFSIVRAFHQATKIKKGQELRKIPPGKWPREWRTICFKSYPRLPKIPLARIDLPVKSLQETLLTRQSQRKFSNQPISFRLISQLLLYSAGVREQKTDWNKTRRTYPSGGARYPLEIYLAVLKNGEIPEGIYHYNVKEHSLEELLKGNFRQEIYQAISQEMIKKAPLVLLISAVFQRTMQKYKDFGYRLILFEAGHLGQNISLVATNLGLKCCAIGGGDEDKINSLLDLDGESETVIYFFSLGK